MPGARPGDRRRARPPAALLRAAGPLRPGDAPHLLRGLQHGPALPTLHQRVTVFCVDYVNIVTNPVLI